MKKVNLNGYTHRIATPEDLVDFYGATPKESIRAIIFFDSGGKIVAIGGVKRERGRLVSFSEKKAGATLSKMTIGRFARVVMEMIRTYKVPIWAAAERQGPETARLMKHYGYVHEASNQDVEIYTLWPN